ncbi:hypothetical protein CK203_116348 [Vitis vinifera]|uniref:Uncharacterized protein n=1 Tax=Vitis vinifera TaxID=29760 RepID=A0A438D7A5_VITVI|nr:hypothetical protein CK203_116348 [Vitis vinifera]
MSPPCLFWCIWRGHNDQIFDEEKLPDQKLNENLVKSFLGQSGAPLDPLRAQTFKDSSTAPSINTKCTLKKGILPTSTLTFAHSSSVLRRLQRSKIAITGDPKPQQCMSKQLIVTHPYTSICNTNSQESSPSHELVNGEDLLPNNLPYEETKPRWCILIPC